MIPSAVIVEKICRECNIQIEALNDAITKHYANNPPASVTEKRRITVKKLVSPLTFKTNSGDEITCHANAGHDNRHVQHSLKFCLSLHLIFLAFSLEKKNDLLKKHLI